MMRLIDANDTLNTIEKYCGDYSIHDDQSFDKDAVRIVIKTAETIDPIHAANACYCRECWYYTEWGECKEFGDIMKPDEFCSRGVMKNGEAY